MFLRIKLRKWFQLARRNNSWCNMCSANFNMYQPHHISLMEKKTSAYYERNISVSLRKRLNFPLVCLPYLKRFLSLLKKRLCGDNEWCWHIEWINRSSRIYERLHLWYYIKSKFVRPITQRKIEPMCLFRSISVIYLTGGNIEQLSTTTANNDQSLTLHDM